MVGNGSNQILVLLIQNIFLYVVNEYACFIRKICLINLFQHIDNFHVEISHLFCSVNQMIVFYMKRKTAP